MLRERRPIGCDVTSVTWIVTVSLFLSLSFHGFSFIPVCFFSLSDCGRLLSFNVIEDGRMKQCIISLCFSSPPMKNTTTNT